MNEVLIKIGERLGITSYTLSDETCVSDNNKGNNVLLGNTNWSSTQHNNVRLNNLNVCVIENRIYIYFFFHHMVITALLRYLYPL